MKKIMIAGLLLCCGACFAQVPSLSEVRSLYQKAAKEEQSCKKLIILLSPYDANNNPLLLGYRTVASMMMARHVINPLTKWSLFEKGKKLMDKAIDADMGNVELRFLRFGVQTNAPAFLGYAQHIQSDKAFLLRSMQDLDDAQLKQLIVPYLKASGYLSEEESRRLL